MPQGSALFQLYKRGEYGSRIVGTALWSHLTIRGFFIGAVFCLSVIDAGYSTERNKTVRNHKKRKRIRGKSVFVRRAGAMLVALALCVGLMPHFAWAELGGEQGGQGRQGAEPSAENVVTLAENEANTAEGKTATLTIVFGLGWDGAPDVALNKTYAFNEGDTVKTLFDSAVAAGDLSAYALDAGGSLSSVTRNNPPLYTPATLTNAADSSTYWSIYVNGSYASFGNVEEAPLGEGQSYQFAWNSFPTATAPDWSSIENPTGSDSDSEITNPSPSDPVAVSEEVFRTLFTHIAASYAHTGEDWEAMDMAAIGQADAVDREKIIANALNALQNQGTTNLQKSVIALTALGIDAANVQSGGQSYNLIEAMALSELAHSRLNTKFSLLLAYASGDYSVPSDARESVDDLVAEVSAYLAGSDATDADMTAFAIAALEPYGATYTGVTSAIQNGIAKLHAMQLPDGGFASYMTPGVSNANSTAVAIIALSAVGIDAQTWVYAASPGSRVSPFASSAATPLNFLLTEVNETHTDFLFEGVANALATEQGFRALIAYQGFKNTGSPYNIYTQAAAGIAALSASSSTGTDDDKALAATGDSSHGVVPAVAMLALTSLVGVWVFRRRMCEDSPLVVKGQRSQGHGTEYRQK